MPGEDGRQPDRDLRRRIDDADPAADRAGRDRGPDRGAGGRGRRLPGQAVRAEGAAAADQRDPAPHAARRAGGRAAQGAAPRPDPLRHRAGRDVARRRAGPADRDREPADAHLLRQPRRAGEPRAAGRGPGPRQAGRRRSARSTCRSPGCAARSRPIRSSRAICRRCAARATCWRPTEPGATGRGARRAGGSTPRPARAACGGHRGVDGGAVRPTDGPAGRVGVAAGEAPEKRAASQGAASSLGEAGRPSRTSRAGARSAAPILDRRPTPAGPPIVRRAEWG